MARLAGGHIYRRIIAFSTESRRIKTHVTPDGPRTLARVRHAVRLRILRGGDVRAVYEFTSRTALTHCKHASTGLWPKTMRVCRDGRRANGNIITFSAAHVRDRSVRRETHRTGQGTCARVFVYE